ncbi:sulfite exporter TauE/SafE family protein [Bacillus sp. FJAT-29790]|uniref:sulfite exporter TauE/SafE family protein n=1 Tax=Bacillus sp. FJAT-29790 TaxID=1895002 RepID=UPI001C223A6D|nr:sulfite exporter TauE/SafE family protein [Bacillus sp. FJAT-29790]MBU8879975.1 sulfite exporter TauE/SafE family protein [Bacillus sp. FJAT-29790]
MEIGIIVMGLFVGFLVGLTGVGGASLLTPILMLIGINPIVAVGTDLFYNSATKLFGTIQHWRQKTINGRIVLYLSFGSIPGAVIAIVSLKIFDFYFQNLEQIIKHSIGYVLIFVAAAMIFQNFFSNHFKMKLEKTDPIEGKKGLSVLIGFLLGFIVGLTSIGSGSLFALALLYIYRIRTSEVVGTDIAHAFALVTVAGILHAGLGHVDYLLAANLLIGSIPGVLLGSSLSAKVPAKPLRVIMAVLIFISGVKLIF